MKSVNSQDERFQAFQIILQIVEKSKSLNVLLVPSLSSKTKAMCFGFCRHYYRLEAIADLFIKKKPKDPAIYCLILLGIYQLFYMHEPDYAVVQETVDILNRIKKIWAKGLVNGVLRNVCRKKEEIIDQIKDNIYYLYGHPTWLLEEIQHHWPLEWQSILRENDEHPPLVLRVNKLKNSRLDYLNKLNALDIEAIAHPIAPEGIILSKPVEVQNLPGFHQGVVSVQDGAAQLAANLLTLEPGLSVLDACCAPGGKTSHMLELEPKIASCLALDWDIKRLKRVEENLSRLHLNAQIKQGDAAHSKDWWDGKLFDRILLDAPCSSTGVIRRHPDIKLLLEPYEIQKLAKLQYAMLENLWPLLNKGGILVYATCSIMPAENSEQIAKFIQQHQDCKLKPITINIGKDTGFGRQIFPNQQGMDGFFYSVLEKC